MNIKKRFGILILATNEVILENDIVTDEMFRNVRVNSARPRFERVS